MTTEVRDLGCVRLLPIISHPQPNHVVPFHHHIARHRNFRRKFAVMMRIQDALATACEPQPMVAALYNIIDQLPLAQWSEPVRTHIADGDRLTVLLAIKDNWFL